VTRKKIRAERFRRKNTVLDGVGSWGEDSEMSDCPKEAI